MIAHDQLANLFVEFADTVVDDFDVVELLHHLTTNAALVSGARAVGLMLADPRGRLQHMSASNETGRQLELTQLDADEGPCLDCFRTGAAVVNADLTLAGDRWPVFAPRAVEAGIRSVHAFPMRLRSESIGALNVFDEGDAAFTDEDSRVVQALADVATIAILQERAVSRAEALTEQLQGALTSRVVVEQAKGVVATRLGVTVDQGFEMLRGRARSQQIRLVDLAQAVLDGDTAWLGRPA